jgi:hypothetical protein
MTSLVATGYTHMIRQPDDLEPALLSSVGIIGPYGLLAENWSPSRNVVLTDPDAVRIERVLDDVIRRVTATLSRSFENLPDVFVLKPLSTRRVTLRVSDRGYASFRFVPED